MRLPGKTRLEATLSAYGTSVSLSLPDAQMMQRVTTRLPGAWTAIDGRAPSSMVPSASFTVQRKPGGYAIRDDGGTETLVADAGVAAGMLRTMVRRAIAAVLPGVTCLEASVVRHQGRGIILPARALSGTTTLARALVAAGAELHSEEFALIRDDGRLMSDLGFGAEASAHRAVPVGLVAMTVYRPGSEWAPERMTQAEAVIALMRGVPGARERPTETLRVLRLALAEATLLRGDRGEASDVAAGLLEAVANTVAD